MGWRLRPCRCIWVGGRGEGRIAMTDFDLVRGSGNVFRDLDCPNPELEQLRSILAARIIRALDDQSLTVRRAAEVSGFAASPSTA